MEGKGGKAKMLVCLVRMKEKLKKLMCLIGRKEMREKNGRKMHIKNESTNFLLLVKENEEKVEGSFLPFLFSLFSLSFLLFPSIQIPSTEQTLNIMQCTYNFTS